MKFIASNIVLKLALVLILVLIPFIIFYKTEYFKDVIVSTAIGFTFCIVSFFSSKKSKTLRLKSYAGLIDRELKTILPVIKTNNFRVLFKFRNIILVKDIENNTFIWISKTSSNKYAFNIGSTLFPLFNFKEDIVDSASKFEGILAIQ